MQDWQVNLWNCSLCEQALSCYLVQFWRIFTIRLCLTFINPLTTWGEPPSIPCQSVNCWAGSMSMWDLNIKSRELDALVGNGDSKLSMVHFKFFVVWELHMVPVPPVRSQTSPVTHLVSYSSHIAFPCFLAAFPYEACAFRRWAFAAASIRAGSRWEIWASTRGWSLGSLAPRLSLGLDAWRGYRW